MRHPSVVLLASLVLAACSSAPAGPAAPTAVPVRVATVERRDVPVALHAIGNVEAFQTVTLRSQVEGRLAEVRFKEGDEMRAGDLLFVVDPGPFQAALDQAKANFAKAEAQAANAAVQQRRTSELVKAGIVSRDEWDRVRTDWLTIGQSATDGGAAPTLAAAET